MKKPRCTARSDTDGTVCFNPATVRVLLNDRVGFRCDAHPIPDCGEAKVFSLADGPSNKPLVLHDTVFSVDR